MAAAKKPVKKDDNKKLADVAKPGTTAPDATARPIIVTNRPILQDPMVVEAASSADASEKSSVPATTSSTKVTIKPITVTDNTASDETGAASSSDETVKSDDTEAETDTSVPVKIDSKTTKKTAKAAATEPVSDADTTQEEEASTDIDTATSADAQKPAEEASETTADTEQAGSTNENTDSEAETSDNESSDESSAEAPKPETPEAADAAAKKAAEDEAKHDAAVEQIAESKQYFLPIKTEEQRKTARFALLGTLLIVVLGLTWLDVALDAGLVQLGSVKPLTHFFSQQASVTVPTAATPVVSSKTFTAPIAKVSFRYPSDWQLDNSGSTAKSDTVNLQPKTVRAESLTGINVILLSLPVANPPGTFNLKTVHYQKLVHPIGGKTVYLVDIVYQDAAGKFNLTSLLTNDNSLKVGQKVASLEQSFSNADGKANYFGATLPNVSGGLFTFDSADDAKALLATHQYQQARAILLSIAVAKS